MLTWPNLALLVGFVAVCTGQLSAQLDTIHWLPPMHARDEWGPQYLYLSTPEEQPFTVSIRSPAGKLVASATISNTQPFRYDIGATATTPTLVTSDELHRPLQDKGLVIDGPKKFYAYFRAHAGSHFHAGDLTCKGRAALGTTFRIGHVIQAEDDRGRRANFIGILATEDSTEVILSDFHPGTDFFAGGMSVPSAGPVKMHLQKGESVVFAEYLTESATVQPPNGFMGALVTSSKPVAVNCGSWLAAPVLFQANDIGIDQIAPFERVGKEYILCRGNGSAILEHPIVIAHVDNTRVWLNGAAHPVVTLHAGDYYIVPTSAFSAAGNLYIQASEPVFLYQIIGGAPEGDDASRTAGLMFVPPISCGIPSRVDNIYQPNQIGSMRFDGGLMVVAMKDSLVEVRIDGIPVSIGAPAAVPGAPDFVTYRHLTLFSQAQTPDVISIKAEGAVQVAMYGRNQPASFAAFFSGFSKETTPEIELTVVGDGVCPDTLMASGLFDGVQWIYEDSVLQFGPDTMLVAFAPGRYVATGYLGVCRRTDFAADTAVLAFQSPQFPYALTPPSCFGYADGEIDFGQPYGGMPPYQYSVDNGAHFTSQDVAGGLVAGNYHLVVRDAKGCYNRPLTVAMGQPDSFYVTILPRKLPESLKPGNEVVLAGVPSHPIATSIWTPEQHTGCDDCLLYAFRPEETTVVTLQVWDEMGCPAANSFLISVDPPVYVPNAIRRESSLGNDRFTLFTPEPVLIRQMKIFDRWGEIVFEKQDIYTNNLREGWDGSIRDKKALPGVYVFLAEIELAPGRTEWLRGDITLF